MIQAGWPQHNPEGRGLWLEKVPEGDVGISSLSLGVWHSTEWKMSADSWRKALGGRSREAGRRERWEQTRYAKKPDYLEDVTGEDEVKSRRLLKPRQWRRYGLQWMALNSKPLVTKRTPFWERCYWECGHQCLWAWRQGRTGRSVLLQGMHTILQCRSVLPILEVHLLLQLWSCRLPTAFRYAHKSKSIPPAPSQWALQCALILSSIEATTFIALVGPQWFLTTISPYLSTMNHPPTRSSLPSSSHPASRLAWKSVVRAKTMGKKEVKVFLFWLRNLPAETLIKKFYFCITHKKRMKRFI